jgi:hypothetical protein
VVIEHILGAANGLRPEGLSGWEDAPEGFVPCCYGAANDGPRGCTCWEPIFDVEQAPVQEGPMALRRKSCHDCAYRQGSPERERGEFDECGGLSDVAGTGSRAFACHQGARRIVAWRHAILGVFPYAGAGDYRPPSEHGRMWLADGRPGEYCAGWAALRRALLGEVVHRAAA